MHNELDGSHPHRTLRAHIRLLRRCGYVRSYRVDELVEEFGLASLADRTPSSMSPGQQQCVSLLGPLASTAPLLLLDEPFLALDAHRIEILEAAITDAAALGRAIMVSSHAPEPLAAVATRVIQLDSGGIAFQGSLRELIDRTRPTRVRLRSNDVAGWARTLEAGKAHPVTFVSTSELEVEGVSMAQVLSLARQEDLELSGVWEDTPTLREALRDRKLITSRSGTLIATEAS